LPEPLSSSIDCFNQLLRTIQTVGCLERSWHSSGPGYSLASPLSRTFQCGKASDEPAAFATSGLGASTLAGTGSSSGSAGGMVSSAISSTRSIQRTGTISR